MSQVSQMNTEHVVIIGGGLAGCEAAWQAAQRGTKVLLYEMKPRRFSPAHRSEYLAELVCSNSLRSNSLLNAVGLLKEEMRRLGSLIMEAADRTRVPAGEALAVDREEFAKQVTQILKDTKGVEIIREEVQDLPEGVYTIVATGPLPSPELSQRIRELTGEKYLYFYDAIAPIIEASSINLEVVFRGSRHDRDGNDYLNCPLSAEEYYRLVDEILQAEKVPLRDFEESSYFEGCLPIEEMARRGRDTLAYGPMRPVGLIDPRTGKRPYAVVQLRQDNFSATLYNLVGFQTRLKWGEQERVFRLIPGLERAEFLRFGSLHRNTYINSPVLLQPTLQFKGDPLVLFAGQIIGVEGYLESAAMGLLAGIGVSYLLREEDPPLPPPETVLGSLVRYVTSADPRGFQPMNANFGLLPPLRDRQTRKKEDKRRALAERALVSIEDWKKKVL